MVWRTVIAQESKRFLGVSRYRLGELCVPGPVFLRHTCQTKKPNTSDKILKFGGLLGLY